MKKFALMTVCLMVACLFVTGFNASSEDTRNTLYVGAEMTYTTIQSAVDAASSGDTIAVSPGTYYEHVVIEKDLTIIGSKDNPTIINGSGTGNVVEIYAAGCTLTNLRMEGSGSGEFTLPGYETKQWWRNVGLLVYADDCVISNCNFSRTEDASLFALNTENTFVYNCTFFEGNDGAGCLMQNCKFSNITDCIFISSSQEVTGVTLRYGSYNTISHCESDVGFSGVSMDESHMNTISNFKVYGGSVGIYLIASNNNIIANCSAIGCYDGYKSWDSDNNLFYGSESKSSISDGFYIYDAKKNRILNCISMSNTKNGMYMEFSDNGTVRACQIETNGGHGVLLTGTDNAERPSGRNLVYQNNFVDNINGHASDGSVANMFDNGSCGNYWSDNVCPDADKDGFSDSPYTVSGTSKDHHPYASPIDLQKIDIDIELPDDPIPPQDPPLPNITGNDTEPEEPVNGTDAEPAPNGTEDSVDVNDSMKDNATENDSAADDIVPSVDDDNTTSQDEEDEANSDNDTITRPSITEIYYDPTDMRTEEQQVFSCLINVSEPSDVTYAWYLDGTLVGSQKTIQLDLPAGTYNLTVIVYYKGDVAAQKSATITIKDDKGIFSPENAWVLYMVGGLLVLTLILVFIMVFKKRNLRPQKEQGVEHPDTPGESLRIEHPRQQGNSLSPRFLFLETDTSGLYAMPRQVEIKPEAPRRAGEGSDEALMTRIHDHVTGDRRPSHFSGSKDRLRTRLEAKYRSKEIDEPLYRSLLKELEEA